MISQDTSLTSMTGTNVKEGRAALRRGHENIRVYYCCTFCVAIEAAFSAES